MATPRRVAVMIDLQWPLKHHQDVFAGVMRYASGHTHWECVIDLHAGGSLRPGEGRSAYHGVIARATQQLVARARRANVPVVNVWRNSPTRNVPSILPDVVAGGRMAADHLMARGLRHFAFLGYNRDRATDLQAGGFEAAVAAAGFPCTIHLVPMDLGKDQTVWRRFQAGLEQWIDAWQRPIGVCVAHDILARYLAAVCQRKAVSVPDDAAIVGSYNELIVCRHPEPALSSVDFGFEELGYHAAELLEQLMGGAKAPKSPILTPPVELVARRSTDVFAVSDPMVARAMRFIAEHGDEQLRVGQVAGHVYATRRTLERRFQSSLGRTVSGEIARLRIERVKRQLVESDAPVKTLAARLGFRNAKRLCEAFRNLEGMTPGQYRRQRKNLAESQGPEGV